ncbi:MAG: MMPL family transporter [Solirubrobacterales bacterium]
MRRVADFFVGTARRVAALLASAPRRIVSLSKRLGSWLFEAAVERPGRVLVAASVLAVVGWGLGTQVEMVSDLTRLVPTNQREVRDLRTLQRETGVSGDINVVVRSDQLTSPRVIRWMADYQKRVLGRHGYLEGRPCKEAQLCPALSLTNLFTSGSTSPKQINALIDALPPYFSQAVITPDRKTANMAFGIQVMPFDEQKRLVDDMRAQLDPPRGVSAHVAGLPVLAADANANLESSRWIVTGAGLLAVLLVLLIAYRRAERAIVPLVPVALATGWSGLALFCTGIPLNPMSATLGALVIAISTEFSVILSARYRDERGAGREPREALVRTYLRTGTAVAVSGVTAIAGFAALIASDFRMLRDFGLATVVDLSVALAGVLVVLPAVLVWAERRGPLRLGRRSRKDSEGALGSESG